MGEDIARLNDVNAKFSEIVYIWAKGIEGSSFLTPILKEYDVLSEVVIIAQSKSDFTFCEKLGHVAEQVPVNIKDRLTQENAKFAKIVYIWAKSMRYSGNDAFLLEALRQNNVLGEVVSMATMKNDAFGDRLNAALRREQVTAEADTPNEILIGDVREKELVANAALALRDPVSFSQGETSAGGSTNKAKIDSSILIKAIKKFPQLYDPNVMTYKKGVRNSYWTKVQEEVGGDVVKLKEHWKNLKQKFNVERAKEETKWPFFKDLEFLGGPSGAEFPDEDFRKD